MSLNLNNYSFDEWIEFVFNHPIPSENADAWYWDDEWKWEADAEHIIKYCIRLFRNPNFLLEKFSPEQINQGFWFLLGATDQLQDWLWNRKVDWKLREDCIMSDITRAAVKVIKSIYYERFRYSTTACNEILLDRVDIPQQPDELCLFGKFGGSGARPTLPCFVSRVSIFETDVGMVCSASR